MRRLVRLVSLCLVFVAGPVQAQDYTVVIPARCAKRLFEWYERGFHPGEVCPLVDALQFGPLTLNGVRVGLRAPADVVVSWPVLWVALRAGGAYDKRQLEGWIAQLAQTGQTTVRVGTQAIQVVMDGRP